MTDPVQELAPGLWRWTAPHPEFHPEGFEAVACFALRDGDRTLLIDPLLTGDDDPRLAALDDLAGGEVRILITVPYHVRSAEALWRRYRDGRDVTIHGHPDAARRLHDATGFRELRPGQMLPGGALAHAIGRPRRSEMPIWLPSHRALAFGDTVLETGGVLRVWDDPLTSERRERWYRERFLPTLEALLVHDVERVLVTHGEPVLDGARAALEAALAAPPWSRRSS